MGHIYTYIYICLVLNFVYVKSNRKKRLRTLNWVNIPLLFIDELKEGAAQTSKGFCCVNLDFISLCFKVQKLILFLIQSNGV